MRSALAPRRHPARCCGGARRLYLQDHGRCGVCRLHAARGGSPGRARCAARAPRRGLGRDRRAAGTHGLAHRCGGGPGRRLLWPAAQPGRAAASARPRWPDAALASHG
jgi:hypothetical protein